MPAKHPITPGTRYSKLTIVRDLGLINKYTMIVVQCDCGNERAVRYSALRNGSTKSCGICPQMTHGYAGKAVWGTIKQKTYQTWSGIIRRCANPNQTGFEHYGGRGIKVCDRWMESFENFLTDMGEPPSKRHSIERVDVNGNYEPSNCIWAMPDVQARNKRNVRQIEFNGRTMTIADWARELGFGERMIWMRLSYGWSVERTLTTPSDRKRPAAPPKPVL